MTATTTGPGRKERREAARAARAEAEREEAATRRRKRRLTVLLSAIAAAAVLVIVLVATASSGKDKADGIADGGPVAGVPEMRAMLAGIPQQGITLGDPRAKVTVVEFIDPQCPICAGFANGVFPTIVQDYVRAGKVRYEYRTLHFIDSHFPGSTDSVRGAAFLNAAGFQNRMFDTAALLFANQGEEGSGFLTPAYARGIGGAVPGLDAGRALRDAAGAKAKGLVAAADGLGARAGVGGTPTVLVGRTGGTLTAVDAGQQVLTTSVYTTAIDAALAGAR